MLRAVATGLMLLLPGQMTLAQGAAPQMPLAPDLAEMFDAVGMDENFRILTELGISDAADVEQNLFPGRGGAAWTGILGRLYSPEPLFEAFVEAFPADRLSAEHIRQVTRFYSSDLGRRIIEGELTAWEAMGDDAVEAAANQVYFDLVTATDPRLDLLTRFTEVNDFVDLNVSGALNSNLAFYRGLSDAGAYDQALPPQLMLNEVWSQEPAIREDTVLWLYSFQLMAYEGLSNAELEAYIAFCETPAGQTYNAALFAGFDAVFAHMSYRLGSAAALFMSGETL